MTLIYNATFDKNTRKLSFEDRAGNEIYSFTVPERAPDVDDIAKPLTFRATQDGSTVKLTRVGFPSGDFQTSRDGGNTWTDYKIDTVITLKTSDEVSFRAKSDRTSEQDSQHYFHFEMTGKIEAWHNVMSLYRTNDFATYESVVNYAFKSLFYRCTSLTKAPALPATTLAIKCYNEMFYGCQSLTKSPALPETTLASYCYDRMFNGCSSLNEVHCKMSSSYSSSAISSDAPYWLNNVSSTGTFYTNADANWPSGANGIPTGWTRVNEVAKDDLSKPLTLKAIQDGSTVTLTREGSPTGSFQTSTDGGNTWADYTLNTSIALNIGDEVSFRAKSDRSPQTQNNYFYFKMTGKIEAWHNVMSMIRTNDFATYDTAVDYAFSYLFKSCTSLTKAPVLPATTLADSCYWIMFYGCTSLTKAPELPATTLAVDCYYEMFLNCTSLIKAPELPATTLASRCYNNMFKGCSSLNEVRCQMPSSYSSSDMTLYTKNWLLNVSETGTFYTNADANWPSGANGIPTGWTRVNEEAPVDDLSKPLTFKATQDGSKVTLKKNGSPTGSFQTSRDGGNTWSDYTLDSAITLNTGEEVSFRAKSDRTSGQYIQHYFYFKMTGKIEAWHNVMSLYRTNDFSTYGSVVADGFIYMFKGCTSLTKAPALPTTTLAANCYQFMFYGCTSLTEAPELPATALVSDCYSSMFKGCTSLTKAPELPATTLAQNCYESMFEGCTSLTKAPALSSTTLSSSCYEYMFKGCSSLNEVRCNIPSSYSSSDISLYAYSWLSGVASTGTFYTSADVNWPSGASGIPTGWRRFNEEAPAVDDIAKPLMFRATQNDSTVKLTAKGSPTGSFQTSTDGGNTWEDYTLGTAITLNTGYGVYFRAKSDRTSDQVVDNYFYFKMTGKIEAWHNVMSLYRTNDFSTYGSVVKLAFNYLFYNCTSLTKAPVFPATTLAIDCYYGMFYKCESLVKAPELPATTLASACYKNMFFGCKSLKEVRVSATTRASDSLKDWLSGVSATGDFYCDPNATIFPSGASGIPAGWTRHALADYPTTP